LIAEIDSGGPAMNVVLLRNRFWIFALLVAAIYVVEILVAGRMMRASRPGLVAGAILFDLAVFVPCLYYLFFLRARKSLLGLTPVFLLSLAGAAAVLPSGYHGLIGLVRILGVPAELALLGLVALRVRRFWRETALGGETVDVMQTLKEACAEVVGKSRVAEMLGYELSVLYYALFCWRKRPPAANGVAFSYHRRGSYGAIVAALLLVFPIEMVAVHYGLQTWSRTAAWIVTALELYGVLWLIGDYQAVRLRPLLVDEDVLRVCLGLRWTLAIPYAQIRQARPRGRGEVFAGTANDLRAALLVDPQLILELDGPVVARGLYSITKNVTRVGLAVDDVEGLKGVLAGKGISL
jgi:hypothetical protein